MKNSLTEKTWVPLGIAVACTATVVSLVAAGSWAGAWWASRVETRISHFEKGQDEIKSDIALMRKDIAELVIKPVKYTRRDVRAIRKDIAQISVGPLAPFQPGPLTMSGHN